MTWSCEHKPNDDLPWTVCDSDGDSRATFLLREDAKRYARDRNRAVGLGETGDAHTEVESSLRGTLDDLRILTALARGDDPDQFDHAAIDAVGFGPEWGDLPEEAETLLREYPLCVETTTVFEIVLGTGGPDIRLVVECDNVGDGLSAAHEIRRVLYRYSWTGSAERQLTGDDREVAEEFARHVIPELQ